MFKNFKPLGKRVLVQRQHIESDSLIISPVDEEKAATGKVICISKHDKGDIKVGDIVYIGKYAGIELGSDDLVVIEEDHILGVL